MEQILQRILLLPQVIQDLISEYNVKHRPIMYLVQREIIQKKVHIITMKNVFIELGQLNYRYGCTKCKNCLIWVYDLDKVTELIYDYTFCSVICMIDYRNKFYNKWFRK